jgi:hypothetical protein
MIGFFVYRHNPSDFKSCSPHCGLRNNITFFFEKQIQKHLGYSCPAICFSPDEESGAIATVGFRIERPA